MKPGRQALLGIFMAILSVIIILGSFSLSLAELGLPVSLVETFLPTSTHTTEEATYIPGQPTFTPTKAPTETPIETSETCPPEDGWIIIEIQDGDTVEKLAEQFNLAEDELLEKNCLHVKTLVVGASIAVPPIPTPTEIPPQITTVVRPTVAACVKTPPVGWVSYTVRPGDTLYALGHLTGVPYTVLQQVNCITDPYHLTAYTQIWLPYLPPAPTVRPTYTPMPSAPPSNTPTLPPPATNTRVPTSTSAPTQTATSTTAPTNTSAGTALPTSTVAPPTNTPISTATTNPNPFLTPNPYPYPGQSGSIIDFISRLLNSARRME